MDTYIQTNATKRTTLLRICAQGNRHYKDNLRNVVKIHKAHHRLEISFNSCINLDVSANRHFRPTNFIYQ